MYFDLLYWVLSISILFCAAMVITVTNQIHALFYLIATFIIITISLLTRYDIEFLAFLITIVYIGAVAILFLFIIMMIDVNAPSTHFVHRVKARVSFLMPWLVIVWAAAVYLYTCFSSDFNVDSSVVFEEFPSYTHISEKWLDMDNYNSLEGGDLRELSKVLYTTYAIPFVLGSLILLVAMIGAITMTLKHKAFVKRQDIYLQTNRSFEEAVKRYK